ncbi:hypothetical protein VIGAN_01426800 [Vigna angularis var. angularis]|uniref:Uncharacterized protein n=1 Tax=Vigna angularis var. angularis TaxID=157739 RepID=A0A0S3R761_PHAAN|nr:hypothetical protein VIGAN_01426800 [Vigna angularis var. angularis]
MKWCEDATYICTHKIVMGIQLFICKQHIVQTFKVNLNLTVVPQSETRLQDHNDRSLCSKDLVDEASKRKSGDNLSVVICFQQQPPPNLVAPRSRVHWSFSA